jgi:RNA polymerase sigma-70 factor (ECF subfamily)
LTRIQERFPDPPNAGVLRGRFSRKSSPEELPAHAAVLSRAIAAAKAGESDAMRYLYVRFADNVYGYARSIVRDEHEAEDVTQQVFAKLMVSIHKYEQREVPFSAWILRVTHNLAIDQVRRRRAVPCGDVTVPEQRSESLPGQEARCLREAFSALPPDQREVLVMRHVLGMSPGEIADRLGKSEGSIHGLHHRGRGTLKAALIERGAAPATA